ncbi:predicted protein [Cyanophage PSS2]|nr:predicted protein [Cyanophage PSS2]
MNGGLLAPFFMPITQGKTPKEELTALIEAYGEAKGTRNVILCELVTKLLSRWLNEHDVIAPIVVPEELREKVDRELQKSPNTELES